MQKVCQFSVFTIYFIGNIHVSLRNTPNSFLCHFCKEMEFLLFPSHAVLIKFQPLISKIRLQKIRSEFFQLASCGDCF